MRRPLRIALVLIGAAISAFGFAGLLATGARAPRGAPPEQRDADPVVVQFSKDMAPELPDPGLASTDDSDRPYPRPTLRPFERLPPEAVIVHVLPERAMVDCADVPTYDAVTSRGVRWGVVLEVGLATVAFSAWPRRRRRGAS